MTYPRRRVQRRPMHPGAHLREDFMPDYGLTVASIAEATGVSRQTVNELILERRVLTAEMALRLSRLFGNSADSWLNLQRARDIWDAEEALKDELDGIQPLEVA